jgi:2-iminobutanoate/2-iminopropanoate deaminase
MLVIGGYSMHTGEEMGLVRTSGAPVPRGPYSQAVVANGLVFCAGQVAIDPATGQIVEGDVRSQTRRVLQNLEAVLQAAGSSLRHVVKTTVFLTDFDDFHAMNEVYAEFFGDRAPARSTVEVAALPRGLVVEIDCIALVERPLSPSTLAETRKVEPQVDLDSGRDS